MPGPIFIFASGQRCGSTLLQRFLCSHPQVIIWGEHDGALADILTHFDRLYRWEEMFGHQFQTFLEDGYNNFIPNMNPHPSYTRQAQIKLVENLFRDQARDLGRSIWGFKEVKYGAAMALKLRDLFPDSRVIHLSRNMFECFISLRYEEQIPPEDQPHVPVEQVWTRARTLEFMETWIAVNRSLLDSLEVQNADWFYRLTYEAMVTDPLHAMQQLTAWLSLDLDDFDMTVFDHKLYTDRHKGPDPRPRVRRADLTEDEIALILQDEILDISKQLNFDMSIT